MENKNRTEIITQTIVTAIQRGWHTQTENEYQSLKKVIGHKLGDDSDLYGEIEHLEKRRVSKSRIETLREEVILANADAIAEVLEAAENLRQALPPENADQAAHKASTTQGPINANHIDTVNQTNVAVKGNVYVGPPPANEMQKLHIYAGVIFNACRHVSMRGINMDAADPSTGLQAMKIEQVYVSLDTTTFIPDADGKGTPEPGKNRGRPDGDAQRPLSAVEAVAAHASHPPHTVILGDPGSGKTTFINHLCLCLAAHIGKPHQDWLDRLPGWPINAAFLPVHVILRDFASYFSKAPARAEAEHLWNFIHTRLQARNLAFAAQPILKALDDGSAVVLLDGLDEIPGGARTQFVRRSIAAFAERYPQTRIIVTCRVLSYEDADRRLPNFGVHELAPFDEPRIDGFIQAWYAESFRLNNVKSQSAAARLSKDLRQAVRHPNLWRLAANPLLLTVMATVHTHKGRLPQARVLLYEECVDILLYRWDQVKTDVSGEMTRVYDLLDEAGLTKTDLKRKLWELAYECHAECGVTEDDDAVADIGEWRLIKAIRTLHPQNSSDWADRLITTIKHRSGLLLERDQEVYVFPHRTFQEHLAGAHLSSRPDYASIVSNLSEQGAFWREVILLSVGRLFHIIGYTERPLALVLELCPQKKRDDDKSWRQTWLAGDVLLEIGVNRARQSILGEEALERVRHRLATLLQKGRLTPKERVEAGATLSRLGDSRFDEGVYFLPKEDDLGFVLIKAGNFKMGTRRQDIANIKKRFGIGYDIEDETPRHRVWLDAYSMARYPVTKAQFRVFVQSSGHQADGDWEAYGEDNHPVVNVSWNDATAYADWLSKELQGRGLKFRLPTEAEWEKAARGLEYYNFPYGDDDDPDKMNYSQTGIHGTSPVGCFPKGASPHGILDMAGNVDEWCCDDMRAYSDDAVSNPRGPMGKGADRAIRGGSWVDKAEGCRTAGRDGGEPSYRYRFLGFRLVCLPFVNKDSKKESKVE